MRVYLTTNYIEMQIRENVENFLNFFLFPSGIYGFSPNFSTSLKFIVKIYVALILSFLYVFLWRH